MRALAMHEDAIVVVSAFWQTTCTLVRAGDEGFVIDSPVLPDELDALPAVAEQASFPVSGLLATHADWDHLLGRLAFPEAGLGLGEPSFNRLNDEPGAAQRELREFDEQQYIDGRRPLGLGGGQALPVPGRLSLGSEDAAEIELHPAPGHTADGTAFWMPWLGFLVCGDYLSPVEIPMISPGGSASVYLETLARLAALVDQAESVIPGHGRPLRREEAQRVLEEDAAYLEALVGEGEAPLPAGRRTSEQKRIHAENVARVSGQGGQG
ncbi:MAG TPA: MBL fold metallo-hydrolase [Solirubrobacteraceae bacterium]|jgi:glyoxylase-like metal-dependent hydrolase (beta-lactamase superfamily II)|nr:MBL fold metallo-hydrolase [Solirubrobacteraceae bacterium]